MIAACDTLVNAFGPLVSTVDAAESTYLSTVSTERNDVVDRCARKPVTNHTACFDARQTRAQHRRHRRVDAGVTAVAAFHAAVEPNRTTFWTTIAGLRQPPASSTGSTGSTGATVAGGAQSGGVGACADPPAGACAGRREGACTLPFKLRGSRRCR